MKRGWRSQGPPEGPALAQKNDELSRMGSVVQTLSGILTITDWGNNNGRWSGISFRMGSVSGSLTPASAPVCATGGDCAPGYVCSATHDCVVGSTRIVDMTGPVR